MKKYILLLSLLLSGLAFAVEPKFNENFKRFSVSEAIVNAGPQPS